MLVSRTIVDDEMHIKIRGHRTVDIIQKRSKFLMPMMRLALCDDFAGSGVKRCKQETVT